MDRREEMKSILTFKIIKKLPIMVGTFLLTGLNMTEQDIKTLILNMDFP